MLAILLLTFLLQQTTAPGQQATAPGQSPVPDVRQLVPTAPRAVAEVDTAKAEGEPVGLAWNADGTIYLRVTQGSDAKAKTRHYLITTVPAVSVGQVDQVPEWAASYWTWKAGVDAPGDPTLKLSVEQRRQSAAITNTPGAGDVAGTTSAALATGGGGGEGVSEATALSAASRSVTSTVVTMRFQGQVVAEWTNQVPVPGMRLGWAPSPMGVLAYVDQESHLAILDRQGHKLVVPGTSKVVLPAWSPDGKQIVYLQKKSPKAYDLMITTVK
jgi:hypothetical protein